MTKSEQKIIEQESESGQLTTHERWIEFLRQVDSAGDDCIVSICVVLPVNSGVQSVQMSLRELYEIVINSK